MTSNHWWEAPEYDKRAPMDFPDNRGGRQVVVGKTVYFDDGLNRWVSIPIRVYVGASHL